MFVLRGPKQGVRAGQVHWRDSRGRVISETIEWWRPTGARPNEGRIGRIPVIESWKVDKASFNSAQGRGHKWFWRLVLDNAGRLWADIVRQGSSSIDSLTRALIDDAIARHQRGPVEGAKDFGQEGNGCDIQVSPAEELSEVTAADKPTPEDLALTDELTRGQDIDALIARFAELSRDKPTEEVRRTITRLKRNYRLVQALKRRFGSACQVETCRFTFRTRSGGSYCEAAHVRPLRGRQTGLDVPENILILCANHHKMLDYGAMRVISASEVEIDGRRIRLAQAT